MSVSQTLELTYDERATWGKCPVCDAPEGEWCHAEVGFQVGIRVDGTRMQTGQGAHLARLQRAPQEVSDVEAKLVLARREIENFEQEISHRAHCADLKDQKFAELEEKYIDLEKRFGEMTKQAEASEKPTAVSLRRMPIRTVLGRTLFVLYWGSVVCFAWWLVGLVIR